MRKTKQLKLPIYVVQEHHATNLHWDLRLQANEVLLSWAVPKGISDVIGRKRLAIQTPDHALSWATFKGVIPKGQYGAGRVKIWDSGFYIPLKISKTRLVFKIRGKKLSGVYELSHLEGNKWIIQRIEEEEE